jgi:hypothetical protein
MKINQEQTSTQWIKTKSNAQETKVAAVRILGSILIALSGLILYADKVVFFQLSNTFGWKDTETFVWAFSQTLSPCILMLGASLFKPYNISYTIPAYMYTIQAVWVFNSNLKWDNELLHMYAFGTVILFVLLTAFIHFILIKYRIKTKQHLTFWQKVLDLKIQINNTSKIPQQYE